MTPFPAKQSRSISPGDTLVVINGEDVYGLGLDTLRTRIPGPAGNENYYTSSDSNGKLLHN